MGSKIGETGSRYGRLTVLKEAGKDKNGHTLWLCQCDCGQTIITRGVNLRRNLVQSCGCFQKEKALFNLKGYGIRLPEGEAAFRKLLRNMKDNAKRRKLEWTLTDEDARKIIQEPCFYCGKPPSKHLKNKYIQKHCRGDFPANGLGRINSSKGYTIDNVVPCCFRCNVMKGDMSISEFRDQIAKINKYWIGNGDS